MDRSSQVITDDDDNETVLLTGEDLYLVMKAIDVYAYALIVSNSLTELAHIRRIAAILATQFPKTELDS